MDLVTLALTCGAVLRLTILITLDKITFSMRDWVTGKKDKRLFRFVDSLLACPWCLSVWVGAFVAPFAYFLGDSPWFVIPAALLTTSQVTGMLMPRDNDEDEEDEKEA